MKENPIKVGNNSTSLTAYQNSDLKELSHTVNM